MSHHVVPHMVRRIDHVTYVTRYQHADRFLAQWESLGFKEFLRLETRRFPATHIALHSGENQGLLWATMTGLSVSEDVTSPINRFIELYGAGTQHVAYNLPEDCDLDAMYASMERNNWTFMTPVLTYEDRGLARLKQFFTAPEKPYGPFVEFVQRLPGPDGRQYNGFDISNIDNLYEQYADYSEWLRKR